jgi:integrase
VFPDRIILWGDGTKSGKSRPILLSEEGWRWPSGSWWKATCRPWASSGRLEGMRARPWGSWADKEFVFHGCRHTFAVRAVEAGVPIRTLQQWMGHETIEMTERYGKVSGLALETARDMMFAKAA